MVGETGTELGGQVKPGKKGGGLRGAISRFFGGGKNETAPEVGPGQSVHDVLDARKKPVPRLLTAEEAHNRVAPKIDKPEALKPVSDAGTPAAGEGISLNARKTAAEARHQRTVDYNREINKAVGGRSE